MKKIYKTLAVLLISTQFIVLPIHSQSGTCADVKVIFARGSGQPQGNSDEDLKRKKELVTFFKEIKDRAASSLKIDTEELVYPAAGGPLHESYPIFLNAEISWYAPGFYRTSVEDGVASVLTLLNEEFRRCPNQRYILGGYSQGAQVMGDVLFKVGDNIAQKIAYVALFGDPKFSPSSEAAYGDFFSIKGGILEPRKEDFPDKFWGKVANWCKRDDGICEGDPFRLTGSLSKHPTYHEREISIAANYAAQALKQDLSFQPKHIRPGSLGEKVDIVYAVDTTATMQGVLNNMKANVAAFTSQTMALGIDTHIGLVAFRDPITSCGFNSPQTLHLLDNDVSGFSSSFNTLQGMCGRLPGDDVYGGVQAALNNQPWREDARKLIILLSGNTPDEENAFWRPNAITTSRTKGISVYGVVRGNEASQIQSYSAFTESTGGYSLFMQSGATSQFMKMYEKISELLAQLPNEPIAKIMPVTPNQPGQIITFNAGGSYDPDGTITQYEWDFENDGIFETSDGPVATHTYPTSYNGLAIVRVTAADGGKTIAATQVSIDYTNPIPSAPAAPKQVTVQLNGNDSATITWQNSSDTQVLNQDESRTGFVIKKANGEVLGFVNANTYRATITDLPKDENIQFALEAINDVGISEPIYTEIFTIPSQPNIADKPSVNDTQFSTVDQNSALANSLQPVVSILSNPRYSNVITANDLNTQATDEKLLQDSGQVLATEISNQKSLALAVLLLSSCLVGGVVVFKLVKTKR